MNKSFAKKALATAILAALPLTASAAGFSGFVSGSYDKNDLDFDGAPSDSGANEFSLRGTLAYDFENNFGLQGDFVHSRNSFDSIADDLEGTTETTDLALHAYYSKDNWRVGAFAQHRSHSNDIQINDPSADPSADPSSDAVANALSPDELMFGIEGQAFFGDFDVSGQVARTEWDDFDLSGDVDVDGTVIALEAGYMVHENWRVGINFSQHNLEDSDGDDFDSKVFGINTEYQVKGSPVSLFASYERTSYDEAFGPSGDADVDTLKAGVKVSFGDSGSSLKESRAKASFNPVAQTRPLGSLLFRAGTP